MMTIPESSEAGRAFWNFSLAVYQQPGVADECLTLQDRLGIDVNLLLFCAYMGAVQKTALSAEDVAEAVAATRDWHVSVVRSLRAARKALKPWSGSGAIASSASALRNSVKTAELEAERIEHDMLADWARTRAFGQRQAPEIAVPGNIRALLDHYGNGSALSAACLIAAALAYG